MDHPMADHPLWPDQVELERGMMRDGAEQVRERIADLREKGQMSESAPARRLIDEWLPKIGKGVQDWCRQMGASRGPKPIALVYLKDQDPYVVALIALRAVMDGISSERVGLVGLAAEIGMTVEHEAKIREWEAKEPDLFYSVQKTLDNNKATSAHRRRVHLAKFGSLMAAGEFGFGWTAWGREVRMRVGIALIDVIVRYAPWFEVVSDPTGEYVKGREAKLVLAVKEGLSSAVAKALDRLEETSPIRKPMVIPPKPWTTGRDGGYWTPYIPQKHLVRFKASQEHQQESAADEYDALELAEVRAALSTLQETSWRVNRRVLEIVETCVVLDQGIGGLPQLKEYDLPPRTPAMEMHRAAQRWAKENGQGKPPMSEELAEEVLRWKRRAGPVYAKNAKRESHAKAADRTLSVANEMVDYERIYFPYMLDFRGRIYPMCSGLQPQGDDLARGLLTFADSLPVGEDGGEWLAIMLASCYGDGGDENHIDMDKEPFPERVAWALSKRDWWLAVERNPIKYRAIWMNADKPWQLLATIIEYAGFLREGPAYASSLPCMVDGTCNGIQHLSAMTRDALAGSLVNLTPSKRPQDIYQFVGDRLLPTVERIAAAGGPEGEKATYWLNLCGGHFNRKMTKRQVMVVPYGGTKDSFFNYTRKWLDKADPIPEEGLTTEEFTARSQRIAFMVKLMWDEVGNTVKGAKTVMEWLQKCAAQVIGDQPIYWETPCGMVVRHFYGVARDRCVETMIDGHRVQLRVRETTNKLSKQDQLRGIAPNFVHSLDASAEVTTINKCAKAGVVDFVGVHDAYGTHAANMWPLYRMLRESFVETHRVDVLGHFRFCCLRVMVAEMVSKTGMDPMEAYEKADAKLPQPLEMGTLDLELVLESDYFFA